MQTAYIALGANLASQAGPPAATLAAVLKRLSNLGRITAQSSLYRTAPVGFADQPRFVNAVVALETELGPRALLNQLLVIEKEYGRDRSTGIPNGPRTLDLDILLIGDLVINLPELELPHPRMTERAFVLVPLHEIAPRPPPRVSRRRATSYHGWARSTAGRVLLRCHPGQLAYMSSFIS